MVKELVFHIGDYKTGSTSVQSVLSRGQVHIPKVNLFYPAVRNHNGLARSLSQKKLAHLRAQRFRHLAQKLDASEADMAVVSAETFEGVNPRTFRAAIRKFLPQHENTARFIGYVRPHGARLVSSYGEQIKLGLFSGTLEQFHEQTARRGRFLYTARFSRWRKVFKDRFELRPLVRAELYKGCVVHDFLKTTLQNGDFTIQNLIRRNSSLSVEQLAIMLEYQNALREFPKELRVLFGRRAGHILTTRAQDGAHTKLHMPHHLAQKVHKTYHADAQALDRRFFADPVMSQALEAARISAPKCQQSILAEDIFDPDSQRLLRRNASAIASLIKFAPEVVKERFATVMNTTLFAR